MDTIQVVFWSQTGNTEAMAYSIAEGIKEAGAQANVVNVASASMDDIKSADKFAIGCPAMGAEVLEEYEMEPFVEELEGIVKGKTVALFGSYGWGDGEWMRDWESRMQSAGATLLNGEGLIINEAPDADGIEQCKDFGKALTQ